MGTSGNPANVAARIGTGSLTLWLKGYTKNLRMFW